MVDRLLSIIAPHSCCSCGNVGTILCQFCKNDIISEPFVACIVCQKPTIDSNLCSSCGDRIHAEAAWCVGARESHLKALLDHYKFNSAKEAGVVCIDLLDARLPVLPDDLVVMQVPTSPGHIRVRGFDHTALITRGLARRRGLAYDSVLVRRDNDTQHFKTRTERLKAAASGFEVVKRPPESILLIDDIYTTGATIQACLAKLQEAGVKRAFVATIARQTLDETRDLW